MKYSIKPQNSVPRKAFVRPHLDWGNFLNDQASNNFSYRKPELFQSNTYLAITETISGTSQEKKYQELRFHSLQLRHCFRKYCLFSRNSQNRTAWTLFSCHSYKKYIIHPKKKNNFLNTKYNFLKNSFLHLSSFDGATLILPSKLFRLSLHSSI